ncbi:hypothetical protein SO802_016392 [Lithocarpus litseifolius]|uniref:RNase H type-1 domain-containing protein n=1 Tax=Lithocarpus litseifolius TaxID=425828 RepID=A0AAW2D042_9ROSI
MDPNCPLCDASPKSSLHLFVFCHAARSLYAGNVWGYRPDAMQFYNPEAEAINLATYVAVNREFENVVVESDAKACIKALKAPTDAMPWRISTIIANTLSWAFCGQQFVFRWSSRESNKAAHVLASWCPGKNLSGCFGQGYAPSPFMDVINSEHLNAVVAV